MIARCTVQLGGQPHLQYVGTGPTFSLVLVHLSLLACLLRA